MSASSHSFSTVPWAWLAARTAQSVLVAAALAAVIVIGLATMGTVPWLVLPVALEGGSSVDAGPGVQIGIALLLVTLCGVLPGSDRVLRLEMSHRRFHAGMEDVAHAYYVAHSADRQGAFRLTHEFDAVRERLVFLRNHPDVSALQPEILELAAQMSHIGRDLARIYSSEKVATARELLAQRGDEAARIEADVIRATRVTQELTARLAEVEGHEGRATGGIDRLRIELDALLPRLALVPMQTERAETEATAPDKEAPRETWMNGQPSISVVRS